jgi:hypothetical protein
VPPLSAALSLRPRGWFLLWALEVSAALKPVCDPRPRSIQDPLLSIFVLHPRLDDACDNPHFCRAPPVFAVGPGRGARVPTGSSPIVPPFLGQVAAVFTTLAASATAFQFLQIAFARLVPTDFQARLPSGQPRLATKLCRAARGDNAPSPVAGDLCHVADCVRISPFACQLVATVAERRPQHCGVDIETAARSTAIIGVVAALDGVRNVTDPTSRQAAAWRKCAFWPNVIGHGSLPAVAQTHQ